MVLGPLSEAALILAPMGRDGDVAAAILGEAGYSAQLVRDIPGLCAGIRKGAGMAFIADEALLTSDLRPLSEVLAGQEPWSDFPIIVMTRGGGGGPERNPVATRFRDLLGNVSFLERPFHPTTMISIAASTLRARRRQYEARASLELLRKAAERQRQLVALDDRLRELNDPAEISYAAAEQLGKSLGVSRAGYGTVNMRTETITMDRDWNAQGINTLAGTLKFRDYGSYIDALKRGETVVIGDVRQDDRTFATADALIRINASAFVNMPVTEQGDFVALLYLTNDVAREWEEEDLAFIREVAQRTRTIVARRQAEIDLRRLATSLEQQVEERTAERDRVWRNSRDLLLTTAKDGIIRRINPASKLILGYEQNEMAGRSLTDFIWEEDSARRGEGLMLAAGTDLNNFENRFRHRDGSPRWLSWHTAREGDLVYAYGRDITDSKQKEQALHAAEEQLRQAQKMEAVGQLTGGLAHDFNNLLAAISGSLEMLEHRIAQGRAADYERYLQAAKNSAKRAAALTHRLLAFSRRQTLDPKPIHVNRLVTGMEDLIRRTMGPHINVEFVGAAGLWTTFLDAAQLENSLLNLCINARDAMPDGGRLTIETANRWIDARTAREQDFAAGQYVSLCVSDTGTGMTPEVIARAFDPFFTTKPTGLGTGLGLSMVYGFAKQSGGQVRIYSEPGKGSMVCIYLPRHAEQDEVADEKEEVASVFHAGAGEKVLVVDDEAIVRMLIVDVLTDLGYEALEAHDGPSATKILESGIKLDLLITDVGLPGGMNGRQVADAARARQPNLKVMFVTGYAENAAIGAGHLEAGMHVLTKPFPIEELGRRIKEVIGSDG